MQSPCRTPGGGKESTKLEKRSGGSGGNVRQSSTKIRVEPRPW